MKFDEALEKHVGSLGRYQILIVALAAYLGIPVCLVTVDTVFTAAAPNFRCAGTIAPEEVNEYVNLTLGTWRSNDSTSGEWSKESCRGFFQTNGTFFENGTSHEDANIVERPCENFEYDTSIFKSTVITEWDVVCNRSFMASITKSIAMAGVMVGAGLGGFLADRFGRRPVVLASTIVCLIARFLITFSPNLLAYNVFNFLTVTGSGVCYIVAFTLAMELVGPKWRAIVGSLIGECFGVGYLLLAMLGYFLRDWKTLNIAISSLFIPGLLFICILPESPRWMLAKSKTTEAYEVLSTMARRNGNFLPSDVVIEKMDTDDSKKSGIVDMFKSKQLVCRYLVIFFAWFVAAFTYYGITLNVGSLVGNIYLNVAITGLLEIGSYFITQFLVGTPCGRRFTTCVLYLLAGSSLLLTLAVPKAAPIGVTVLVLFGRFCVSAFYNCIYIWSGELFPTVIRNSGLSTTSCIGKTGAVLAPYATELVRLHPSLPIITFGCLAILCGLSLLNLPETRGCPLPQTVEDIITMSNRKPTYKSVRADEHPVELNGIKA